MAFQGRLSSFSGRGVRLWEGEAPAEPSLAFPFLGTETTQPPSGDGSYRRTLFTSQIDGLGRPSYRSINTGRGYSRGDVLTSMRVSDAVPASSPWLRMLDEPGRDIQSKVTRPLERRRRIPKER